MEASTVTQEQFYTPSSSRDIDLIRTDPEYSSDPATPTPPQTGATSTSYKILRYLDVDAINPMSSEGAFPDLSSAHANAHFDIEAFVELDDTEQQLALVEGSHTPPPPPHLHAPEDEAPQRQSSSSGASVRQGALKRKRISTGELAPVERPSKRQLLVTDELAQRSTSPPPPAQLMTPSDTTVERSRKRKLTHTGTNVDTPEPVEAERMVSPCTALLDRRLQAPIGEQGDTVTSARLLNTTAVRGHGGTGDGPRLERVGAFMWLLGRCSANQAKKIGAQAITGCFRTVATAVAESEEVIRLVPELHSRETMKLWVALRSLAKTNPLLSDSEGHSRRLYKRLAQRIKTSRQMGWKASPDT
ncbi:hypothetical protein LTR87_017469 [Friedmanniomyces endolithicus]|nr:hypothetical protein LTR87_017469 [Friedmanniomyces endolithicus]